MANTSPSFFKFYADISGIPNRIDHSTGDLQTTVIGMVSVSKRSIKAILDELKTIYPDYWDKKGHQLNAKKLEDIVRFFNQRNVKMVTIQFEKEDWGKYRSMYPHETGLGEKVMAILYFYVLKHLAFRSFSYEAVLDNDTMFSIHQCILICNRLLKKQNFDFEIFLGHRDINAELRLPDWIAQARRKIPESNLNKYGNFIILNNNLAYIHRLFVFKSLKI